MALGRKTVLAVIIDIICVFIVALPCLILYLAVDPYQRGFFCNDENLRHPYKSSTIPTSVLIVVSSFLPITIFIAVELALARSEEPKQSSALGTTLYNTIIIFLFGMAVNQLLTDICKYTVGRLRPHFFAVCKANITWDEQTCGSALQPKYVEEFNCIGSQLFETEEERREWARDARLSFVSGHASMSAYAMVFAIIYLQFRLTNRHFRLCKPLIQTLCAVFFAYTSLSRISDYKHHPGDVLSGALLGIAVCVTTHYVARNTLRRGVDTATSTTNLLTGQAGLSSYTLDRVSRDGNP